MTPPRRGTGRGHLRKAIVDIAIETEIEIDILSDSRDKILPN